MSKVIALNDRTVLKISGPDAKPFLQGLVTNDMGRLAPGRSIYAALLTPQGKIISDFILSEAGEAILVDCAASRAPDLAARLKKFRLRAKVQVEEAGPTLAVLSSPDAPPANIAVQSAAIDPRLPELGWRWILEAETLQTLDIEHEPHASYDRHRIECGVPDSDLDLKPETFFPLDCNFEELQGVDFNKGCYVGQELTARMKHRATSRRRILPVAGAAPLPPHGTSLRVGDMEAGEMLGSQGPIGLAILRLDRLGESREVLAGDRALQVGRPHYALTL
jgi:tRNA-modifying protein YgfZ